MAAPRTYDDEEWLSRKEAARFLASIGCPVAATTLSHRAARRNSGNGPPFTRTGHRTVRYQVRDLRTWAQSAASRVV